jgi:hypothetical protein
MQKIGGHWKLKSGNPWDSTLVLAPLLETILPIVSHTPSKYSAANTVEKNMAHLAYWRPETRGNSHEYKIYCIRRIDD